MSSTLDPRVRVVQLAANSDSRGSLIVGQYPDQLPFQPLRFFVVSDVEAGGVRGDHAHRECHQLLVCTSGLVEVEVVGGNGDVTSLALSSPETGLHIPPLVWARQRYLQAGSVLLVLASHSYSPAEYISDFAEYAALCD